MRRRAGTHVVHETPFLLVEREGPTRDRAEVYVLSTFAGEPAVTLSPVQLAELVAALHAELAGGDYIVLRRSSRSTWEEVRRG